MAKAFNGRAATEEYMSTHSLTFSTPEMTLRKFALWLGEPVSLPLRELVMEDLDELTYSFKYFQDFEGDMRVPAGFEPLRVDVAVLPGGRATDAVRRTIDWTEASS